MSSKSTFAGSAELPEGIENVIDYPSTLSDTDLWDLLEVSDPNGQTPIPSPTPEGSVPSFSADAYDSQNIEEFYDAELATPPPEEQLDWAGVGTVNKIPSTSSNHLDQTQTEMDIDPALLDNQSMFDNTADQYQPRMEIDPSLLSKILDTLPSQVNSQQATDDSWLLSTPAACVSNEHSDFGTFDSLYPDPEQALNATAPYQTSDLTVPYQASNATPTYQPDWTHETLDLFSDEPAASIDADLGLVLTYPNEPPVERETGVKTSERSLTALKGGKRSNQIKTFKTEKFYNVLPSIPEGWGGPEINGEPRFQYDEFGELIPGRQYTPEQILEFIYQNPRNLVLWIQTTPADSSRRYPHAKSDKCRFIGCPVKNHTIHKGFFRVAFDEHSQSKLKLDPYLCAGFVHLHCLEKFLNFPRICKERIVLPDSRRLPEGKNKMAVTRDHSELFEMVNHFKKKSQRPIPLEYSGTLCSALTEAHFGLEANVRDGMRQKRGGNHIGIHRGDVDKYAAFEESRPPRRPRVSKKRKSSSQEVEDELPDFDFEEVPDPRPTKRLRSRRT